MQVSAHVSAPAATLPAPTAATLVPGSPLLAKHLTDLPRDQLAHVIAARFLTSYAGHTRAAYRRDLQDYFAWCADHGAPVLDATRTTVDAYARDLAERPHGPRNTPLSPATVARRLATLSGYYRYALSEDSIARSPLAHVRRPRLGQDSPTLG